MKYSSIPSAQTIVHHCKANNIKHIVISPGSRNAPLIIGFTENRAFSCYSIVDERCAAFFALGMAQQQQEPVVLVCTSGSALLNYYPAIAEAYYSTVPLVVISADRPSHKIDIGDGQTIRQENIFQNHIGYSANLKLDVSHATEKLKKENERLFNTIGNVNEAQENIQEYNDRELNNAIGIALTDKVPVHINAPFEEPLYQTVDSATVVPTVQHQEMEAKGITDNIKEFAQIWNNSKKKMVLVGVNPPNKVEQQFLDELAEDGSVIVFTETTSNLHHPDFFPSIDSIIAPIEKSQNREEQFLALQPEVLLTFGGLIVSKKIKAFLREYKPKHHWHVDENRAFNTFYSLSHHFKMGVNTFFHCFFDVTKTVESHYFEHWSAIKNRYEIKREDYLSNTPFSDLSVFDAIMRGIPEKYQLQLANSSTVRYAQLFDIKPSVQVFCNRGTSGIDGSTSTAIGASVHSEHPTLLITGDLSFFYDSNALWNAYTKPNFRMLVINNGGGGIFRILPGHEDTQTFDTYFETTHGLDASHICKMHNIAYSIAVDETSLKKELSTFYEPSNTPKLLEVRTPRVLNNTVLLSYFDFIS